MCEAADKEDEIMPDEQSINMHEDHRRIFEELRRQHISERKASSKLKAIILYVASPEAVGVPKYRR